MNTFQRELSNLRQRQHLLYFLMFSFVTILVWISVTLITSQRRTGISAELQLLAKPLTPTINIELLSSIQAKRGYSSSELQNFPIFKIVVSRDGRSEERISIDEDPETATGTIPSPSPDTGDSETSDSTQSGELDETDESESGGSDTPTASASGQST